MLYWTIFREESWTLEWIRIRVDRVIRFVSGYVWTLSRLNPERKIYGFKSIRIRVDFKIPGHFSHFIWIWIETIVIYLVLQSTPTYVNEVAGYSEVARCFIHNYGKVREFTWFTCGFPGSSLRKTRKKKQSEQTNESFKKLYHPFTSQIQKCLLQKCSK